MYTAEKLATIFSCTVSDLMAINREILKSCQTLHAVSVIPKLVSHILERIPSSNFGPHLLEVSPIWRAEAEQVLWKRHKKTEEAYDRAVEKKEKAGMILVNHLRRRVLEVVNFMSLNGRHIKRLVKSYWKLEKSIVW